MAHGGKSENSALKEFTQELEQFLNVTTQQLNMLRGNISEARSVLNLSTCKSMRRNEQNKSVSANSIQNHTPSNLNDEELPLEGEIRRILQMAEKVRGTAYAKQMGKARQNHFVEGKKEKRKVLVMTSSKSKQPEVSQKSTSSFSKPHKKIGGSSLKTTYRQDFSLKKVKSMPCLSRTSKDMERGTVDTKSMKKISFPEKNQISVTAQVLRSTGESSLPTAKKQIGKSKLISVCEPKKNASNNDKDSSCNSQESSVYSYKLNSNESFLSEEILMRSQIPKYGVLLAGLRQYYSFFNESKRKKKREEEKLKEVFMKKCSISASRVRGTENELESIFKKLLPYCGWANGLNNSFSATSWCHIKDIISVEEEKLKKIICIYQKKEIQPCGIFELPQSGYNSKECSLWNPSITSRIFKEMNQVQHIYYNNVNEWVSFQNAVHELQEYHFQLKILEHIYPIITEYFYSQESNQIKATVTDAENENAALALLLKTMAAIAGLSGHFMMPILTSVTQDNTTENAL